MAGRTARLLNIPPPLWALIGFGIATLTKALGGLVVIKICAIWLGPSIFGQLGQMMTLVAIVSTFAGGGTSSALIHSLSSTSDTHTQQRKLTAALVIFTGASSLMCLLLILFRHRLSVWILGQPDLGWTFVVLAFSQWLVGTNNICQAVLSSLRRTRAMVLIPVLGIILGVGLFSVLLLKYGTPGAALGLVLMPAMLGVFGLGYWLFFLPPMWRHFIWPVKREDIRELLSYAAVMLVSATTVPGAQLLVRNYVGAHVGWDAVGYWQGVLKISDVYMQLVAMMGIYYALPRFSAATSFAALNHQYRRILSVILPVMLAGFGLIMLLRHFVITVLFSPAFLPMQENFLPQLLGDTLRIPSILFIYYSLSRGARLMLVSYELTQAGILALAAYFLLPYTAGMAPVAAHVVASACTLTLMAILYLCNRRRWQDRFTTASPLVTEVPV